MPQEVFLAWSSPAQDQNTDNVEFVRRAYQRTEAANRVLASWVALHRGSIIAQSGSEGKAVVPESALADLPKIKEQYEQTLGQQVNFGVGDMLSEAVKALAISAIRGIGQTTIWSPRQEGALDPKEEQPQDLLLKTEGNHATGITPHAEGTHPGWSHFGSTAKPTPSQGPTAPVEKQSEEGPKPSKAPEWDPEEQSAGDIANLLNTFATPMEVSQGPDLSALKQETGVILKQIKELVPDIEELQSSFPELYQGYLLLAQAFIDLNNQQKPEQESMQKSEDNDSAELVEKSLDTFKSEDFAPEDEKVNSYVDLKTEAPPVFMIGDKVIDGKKRLAAAKKKGDKTIKVYLAKANFTLGQGMTKLPIGSLWGGRIKQLNPETGQPRFKMALSGMIASRKIDPNKSSIPTMTSSTRPND